MAKEKSADLHGNAPDNSPVALLLIDVINDFEFDESSWPVPLVQIAAR